MKLFNRFSVMVAIVSTLVLASYADDVYDPERGTQTAPKENPLGEDFSAPDSFDWSTINAINLNAEIEDEFNGRHKYLIEVFTNNPISNAGVTPIAANTTNRNKSYSIEISIPKATTRLFIRQTGPEQHKEAYEYTIPENRGTMNCKLSYISTNTRAASGVTSSPDSAFEAARQAGIAEIGDKGYKESEIIPSVPATSDKFNGNSSRMLSNGAEHIIGRKEAERQTIKANNSDRTTVFVQGVWELNDNLNSNLGIYVMNGGEIVASNLTIGNNNALTIRNGGNLGCVSLSSGCPTKNFGTVAASKDLTMNLGGHPELFNERVIGVKGEARINGNNVINHHISSTKTVKVTSAQLLNKVNLNSTTDINIDDNRVFNYGYIKFDKDDGEIRTDNSAATVIINHDRAKIINHEIEEHLSVYSDGVIEVSEFTSSSLYNSYTVIMKEEFRFQNMALNKGSITAGRANESDTEWLPVPEIETHANAKLTLIDGSVIKAKESDVESGSVISQAISITNNNKSMIKIEEIEFESLTNTKLLGRSLVTEEKIKGPDKHHPFKKNESINTGFDEPRYTIETCGRLYDEGNRGEEEKDPDFPVEIGDGSTYTFTFEDNWPVYGDFDMNGFVIVTSRKELKVDESNIVERLRITLDLRAVGVTKTLGASIRFIKLPQDIHPDKFTVSGKNMSFEDGQSLPAYVLFNDAHAALWDSEYTDTSKFIGTVADGPFKKDTKEYNIIMGLPASANVKPESLNINHINVFAIITPTTVKREHAEVHVAGSIPADLATTCCLNSGNDNSSVTESRYYFSKESPAQAIVVPQEFAWPIERQKVTTVYDKFKSWITTGRQQDNDWYRSHGQDVCLIESLTQLNKYQPWINHMW